MNLRKGGSVIRLALSSTALLLVLTIQGYSARHERLIDAWRPTNFNVTLKLDERLGEITKARTEITIQSLKAGLNLVDLDFGEMTVDGVWADGKIAQFDRDQGLLNVHLQNATDKGRRFVIAIEYHGKPKDGLIL